MPDLKIEKPMVFFDLETTGTNIYTDRIVELSIVKLTPDGAREVKTRRLNPEMPIPEAASKIHGIRDEDVADAPTFKAISKNLYLCLEGCDLGGYNVYKFDIPLLVREFARAGLEFVVENRKIIDPFVIFCQMEPRNLTAAYKLYCGKDLEGAHGAECDTLATIEILQGQLEKYSELKNDIAFLHEFCAARDAAKDMDRIDSTGKFKWSGNDAVVNFGKNSGKPLRAIAVENPEFLRWMMNKDFPADAKKIAGDALKGVFPEKK